jgi:hypothetical protein
MAADYIAVNRTKQLGNTLVAAADKVRELREMIDKLNDAGNHSFSGADYAVMETNFGLATGTGANTLTLIGLMHTIFNTNGTVAGQTRLDQIDEFAARLAGQ